MVLKSRTIRRGEVYLTALDPTLGGEIQKTRPGVVVSPDELNSHLRTFLVVPLTTGGHDYPFRIPCRFDGRSGHLVLDQLRAIDRQRLLRRLGEIPAITLERALEVLREMFAL